MKNKINGCWLTVNKQCQMRCKWCYIKGSNYTKEEMDIMLAVKLIDIMYDMGVNTCKILGGEPSIYSEIIPLLNKIKDKGMKSIVITNGLVYENKEIMSRHFDAGLTNLIISLKAGSRESYKKLTKTDTYEKVLKSISNLSDFSGGVTITIAANIENEINKMIEDSLSAGAKFINLHFCSPTVMDFKSNGDYLLSPEKAASCLVKAVDFLEKRNAHYNVQISIPFCLFDPSFLLELIKKDRLTSGCILIKQSGIIFDVKGQAGFCNHLMDFPFGTYGNDFTNAQSLQKLYFGQKEMFSVINRAPSTKCLNCPVSNLCCGGCPLKWTCYNPKKHIVGGEKLSILNENFNK